MSFTRDQQEEIQIAVGWGSTVIEWSLQALASMRAVCLILRTQAVVKFYWEQ